MTRHVVWKETREQAAVLLALVGLGGGLLAAAGILGGTVGGPEGLSLRTVNYTGRILLIMLVMTAGIVTGGSLFAGEREAGTFIYLDHLPGSRWRVWWRKVLAGGLLTAPAVALLLLAAGLAGQLGGASRPVLIGWALAVATLAAVGFGWGVFGSVQSASSLAACGLGLAGMGATVVIAFVVLMVVLGLAGQWILPTLGFVRADEGGLVGLLVGWAVLCVPLPLSALLYTAPDRSRRLAEQDIRPAAGGVMIRLFVPRLPRLGGSGAGRRMRWLVWRQLRVPMLVQAAVALVLGLAAVPWNDDWASSVIWPGVGLGLGVLAGVASLGDEQRSGAVRFWAERRLPVGRLWREKVLTGLLMTLAACLIALLPSFLAVAIEGLRNRPPTVLAALFRSGLFERGFPQFTYLLLGPVYGFAFGHLAGLLFPKGVVAGAVGLLVGGTVGALWGPSLLAGGVHGWMVFVPPTVALLTARWLSWPWATDQIGRRGPLLRLAGGTLAALLCAAGGLAYRAVGEVDEVANADEHLRFRAALPTFDEKQAGRDIRRALGKWQELPETLRAEISETPFDGQAADLPQLGPNARKFITQMPYVLRVGWPAGRPDFDAWMDRVYAANWDEPIYEAATKPAGVLEDPNEFQGPFQPLRYIPQFHELTPVFLARGLQLQARGDPADFPRRLAAWLAACRTAKRHTMPVCARIAENCEQQAYHALDRWLERLDGRPDLVQEAVIAVARHDVADKPQASDVRLVEQVQFQNAVDAPGLWLSRWLEQGRQPDNRIGGRAEAEANVAAFAWTVPWEKERLRRAVAIGNDPACRPERDELLAGTPGLGSFALFEDRTTQYPPYSDRPKAARRAAAVSLALRLHRLETGRYPETLDELVPGRMSGIPIDPYDGRPMRYRLLTKPETVTMPSHLSPRTSAATLPPGATLPYPTYLSVAGLAGGLTGWPFQPGWLASEPDEDAQSSAWRFQTAAGGPAGPDLPLTSEWRSRLAGQWEQYAEVPLAAGRAVIWSVGPDRQDDGGHMDGRGDGRGDLIYLVPDPPAASPGTPARAR